MGGFLFGNIQSLKLTAEAWARAPLLEEIRIWFTGTFEVHNAAAPVRWAALAAPRTEYGKDEK
jgi:hypothetical protein